MALSFWGTEKCLILKEGAMLGLPGQLLNFRNSTICSPLQRNIAACPRRQGAECLSLLTLAATINVHATVPTLLGFMLSHVAHCIGRICKLVRQEGERRHTYSGWIFKFNPSKVSVCLANTTNNVIRIGAVTVSGVNTLRSRIQQSPCWLTFPIYS